MNPIQRIAKNTGVLFLAQIISYILGFFYVIYVARYLGAEGFGILSFALSFTAILGLLGDLGLSVYITREISRDQSLANKYLNNAMGLKLILSILTFALIVIVINLLNYPYQTVLVVYLIGLSVILNSFSQIFYSIFQAYEKMEYQALPIILTNLILLIGSLVAIYYNYDIIIFAMIYLVTSLVILVYSFAICSRKFILPKIEINMDFWKIMLITALPFGLTTISGMIYTYIDSVMLSIIQGNEVVGWYSAAYRLILILLFIPIVINTAIFPLMSRYFVSSKELLKTISQKYFKLMLIIGIPIGIITTILAEKIIMLIFGNEFTNSIIALQILIWTVAITFAGAPFIKLLESINKQSIITKISVLCVIINIALNLILIPKYSLVGAAIATVITEIVLVGGVIFVSNRIGYCVDLKINLGIFFKVLISSLVMGIFLWLFEEMNLFILIITSFILYLLILYLIKGIVKEDLLILFNKSEKYERK